MKNLKDKMDIVTTVLSAIAGITAEEAIKFLIADHLNFDRKRGVFERVGTRILSICGATVVAGKVSVCLETMIKTAADLWRKERSRRNPSV